MLNKRISLIILLLTLNTLIFSQTQVKNPDSENKVQKEERTKRDKEKWDNANGRQEFRLKQRLDDNGKYDVKALIEAKKHNDRIGKRKDAGIWDWEWLGPGNFGGRIRAIHVHPTNPNILLIGSASGGIWKSVNGGESWTAVSDFITNLAITSIEDDPNNPDILYAGTGEGFGNIDALTGAGIFKSTDCGDTWTQLISTATWKYCNRLAVHPTQSNIIYAAMVNSAGKGYISKTTDGGISWTNIFQPDPYPCDIKISPLNPARMFVGCYAACYYTNNEGQTWTKLNTGTAGMITASIGRCEGAFAPTNENVLYISIDKNSGEIWKTTDGGSSWVCANTGSKYFYGQGWYDNIITVSPIDENFVLVGGMDLWKSTDGATTLTCISDWRYNSLASYFSPHADQHAIVFSSDFNGTTNNTVYSGSDGGLAKTNNIFTVARLSGWVNLNNGLGITQFYGGASSPDGSVMIGGTQDNGNLKYNATTGKWTSWAGGDGGFCAINYNNPQIFYGEYIYLSLEKSINGGNSYASCTNGLGDANYPSKALFVAPFVMDPNNPSILIAGGTSIWRTINDAANWTSIKTTITGNYKCSAIAISKSNPSVIWVGYENGVVSKTEDNGVTWTDVNTGLPKRYITDIAISPDSANKVIVTLGGYVSTNIYYTSNSGASWELISGTAPTNIPAVQINTVTFNPVNPNWIYIGTDLGVYASEDKGKNWRVTPRYAGNEGPCNVEVDRLFWQGYYLVAATHGRGFYRCLPLNTIIVDEQAAEGGNGTDLYPYNNPNDAFDNAGHGSTIIFRCGDYVLDYMHKQSAFSKRVIIKKDCVSNDISIQ